MKRAVPGLVSVIMPVYRGERFVAAAIESVLAQTYRSFELLIVNDGSPDASAREIARFLPHRLTAPARLLAHCYLDGAPLSLRCSTMSRSAEPMGFARRPFRADGGLCRAERRLLV